MENKEDKKIKMLNSDNQTLKFTWTARPILSDELWQDLPLVDCYAGKLKSKKDISKIISSLLTILPCPQHLKRCFNLRIYLALVEDYSDSNKLKDFLKNKGFDLTLLEDDFEILKIPAIAPKTKSQMTSAAKYWGIHFHPDNNIESLISGKYFSQSELQSIEHCMKIAIKAAENIAVGSINCNGSAVIVNPSTGEILSIAASSVHEHPIYHCSMLAIDLIARLNGGGAWNLIDQSNVKLESKRKLKNNLPLFYPDNVSIKEFSNYVKLTFKEKDNSDNNDKNGPYLCTNYWIFLLQEPCPMCAMALLHSRISKIFYGASNTKSGILGSNAILHSVPGLNHRYLVWGGILENECNKALSLCKTID